MAYTWLADVLRAEGCRVVEVDGWQTRRASSSPFHPVGVVVHHTAPPVPYPVPALYESCNLNIKQNGTVYVISAGYQFDTGRGSYRVRDETAAGIPPPARAYPRGLPDDGWVNDSYFDIEVDHPGDGSPIPDVQREAVIKACAAICRGMDWTDGHVIGHSESTRRKIDPRWNGTYDDMQNIRPLVREQLGLEPEPLPEEDYMYPIYRVDLMPSKGQSPEKRKEDVRYYQQKLKDLGVVAVGEDGVADQEFLDAIFGVVGSPLGGSYFSGSEAAEFDLAYTEAFAVPVDLSSRATYTWVRKNFIEKGATVALTPEEA